MRSALERELGALILRLTVGGLMLFHGIDKLGGVDWMSKALEGHGLPALLRYGVYVGEIVAPLMLILGFMTRTGSALIILTIVMAVYLLHTDEIFALGEHGEYALELHVFYVMGALVVALVGPGKWRVPSPRWLKQL